MRHIIIKTGLIFGLVAVCFFPIRIMAGSINSPQAAEASCNFEGQFKELASTQESNNFDYLASLMAELRIRKNLLRGVLDCSIAEAESLRASLAALKPNAPDMEFLRNRFYERIGETKDYYQVQQSRINDLGIQGTKDVAKNIKEWRLNQYASLVDGSTQLIIWTKNQELFQAAQKRFHDIEQTVRFFNLVDNTEMKELLTKAAESLYKAQSANEAAKEALKRFDASENSLGLIKDSLEALSETYQIFFDLSKAINPHP
jgi:DNA repair ATPase RecN